MPEPRRVRRRGTDRSRGRGLLVGWAIVLAAGCTSAHRDPASVQHEENAAREIANQARRPDRRAMAAPPAPGVPAELATQLDAEALKRAATPLDQLLPELESLHATPATARVETAGPPDRLEAMQAYVLGRSRRLEGDLQNAIDDLRHAARLDPGSPSIWRELGECESAAGNRAGADSAFRRAAELDPSDVRSLEMLSRGALERREYEVALGALIRLRGLDTAALDPALPTILQVRLGRALLDLGYLRAGAEALRSALDLPERFSATTNYSGELSQVYRMRGDLWRDLGDAALRRGDAAEAAADYQRAAGLPGLNPSSILARRITALLRLGRSFEAAMLLVEQSRAQAGRIDDRSQALIRHLAESTDAGPFLSEALAGVQSRLTPEERALASTSLTRARAAALSGPRAMEVLREHLRERPDDDAVVRDLLSRHTIEPPGALLDEVVLLISSAPPLEPRYTGTLLNGPVQPAALLAGWSTATPALAASEAGTVLHARLLASSGEFESAEAELAGVSAGSPVSQAAIVARTEMLLRLGRADEARHALSGLDEGSSDDARAAKAQLLLRVGEAEAALALLTPLLAADNAPASARIDRLLLGARLNLVLERPEAAVGLFEEAIALDPGRDEAYAGLIALYSRGRPLASDARLIETVRALMASNPSSPTLRWLRAQESMSRGQMDLAERDLLDLAEEYPDRDSVVGLLVQVWSSTRTLGKAEQWLRAQSLRRPWRSVYDIELARVLTSEKRAEEAVQLLERRLARAPGDDEVSRQLEQILREDAGRPERAAELTEARLARSPQSTEAMVELAELNLRQGDALKARSTLESLFSSRRTLGAETLERLARLCVEAGRAVVAGRTPLPGPHVELVLFVTIQRPQVPLAAHLAAIQVLARTQGPLPAIIESADRAAGQFPPMSTSIYARAFSELAGQPAGAQGRRQARPADALKVIEHACTTLKPAPASLMVLWLNYSGRVEGVDPGATLSRILELARDSDTIDALLLEFQRNVQAEDPAALAADTAHALANRAQNFDREDLALWLYRVSLRHNPDHAMSNNNLGYSLLRHDEHVNEAALLIARAYQAMTKDPQPEERSSITDSMGWARYRLGIIHDVAARGDAPAVEGAVTLLSRASELAAAELAANIKRLGAAQNAPPSALFDVGCIIDDHLGDALWLAGEHERAIERWTDASARAQAMLKAIRESGERLSALNEREIEDVAQGGRAKAEEARAGRAPSVARTIAPPNSAPANSAPATSGMIE